MIQRSIQFLLSALSAAQFPKPSVPEVAFLGRSNVGKSSLLNALVGEKAAKVSSTPAARAPSISSPSQINVSDTN